MKPSTLYINKEFEQLKKINPDSIILEFENEIKLLVKKFFDSGQSGGSAPFYANAIANAVKSLCSFEPLCGITGEDNEFNEIAPNQFQNKRLSSVFKDGKNGRPYYIDAIIFQGEDKWDSFTGSVEDITSRQYIKSFPFKPKRFRIDVKRVKYDPIKHKDLEYVKCGSGDYVYFIKDRKQLEEVWEYYDKFEK